MERLFDEDMLQQIGERLLKKEETFACAESVTSGLVQCAMSLIKDASKFFQGGVTAYNVGQKSRHLLVEPIHAISCNSISDKVAEDMAKSVCNMFSSHWGTGITGYATASEESGNKLFAHYAIAYKGEIVAGDKLTIEKGEPFEVQLFYANQLLKHLHELLTK